MNPAEPSDQPMNAGGVQRQYDAAGNRHRIELLRKQGVEVWGSARVYISPDVCLKNVCPGAILKNASISGAETMIGRRSEIGTSGTAVLCNSQIGNDVELGAGFYDSVTLLSSSKARGFAEFRAGTLLEETAEVGHNVGLKNIFLGVGVVAGSNINLCDIIVTGGSSRQNHTEIGSGTIHFNFDPRRDKFGSLLGDAAGLLLCSPPIFVGGNVGLVAPLHIGYGAVIPAGTTVRSDVPNGKLFNASSPGQETEMKDFEPALYFDMSRKCITTARLIGTLHALREFYECVRMPFCDSWEMHLYKAGVARLATHAEHRVRELCATIDRLRGSIEYVESTKRSLQFVSQHRLLVTKKDWISETLSRQKTSPPPALFLHEYESKRARHDHAETIRMLSEEALRGARPWLLSIEKAYTEPIQALFEQ
jgi:bifunctional UDP-N-acetylglucosamine pyrophosphorylase/glucosamine-1-phosphate N-acetyltransferase